ncbi:MAG: hypothetical protein IPG97_02465 [Microthrixaceae bacterium]|nr:hypothetical protein [Microthrixaceae bacterium]
MNQYPMKTVYRGTTIRNCRVLADGTGTTVWHWDRDQDAAVVLIQVGDQPRRLGATQSWKVGDLVFEPQRGCGCQHPMYTFVPPAYVTSQQSGGDDAGLLEGRG